MAELFGNVVVLEQGAVSIVVCPDDEYDPNCVGDCQDKCDCYCESYSEDD